MNRTGGRSIRDRAATEQNLLSAVGSLLSRGGFGALGINAVAREAGVDKALIYRYFGGMGELLRSYGESGDFWPSIEEVIGEDPSLLMVLPLADRWAAGLTRYARALLRRPITMEVLAWEQIENNELTRILQETRERWFEDLLIHFPDDPDATGADLIATVLLIVGSIHYFVVRSRLHPDFSGLAIDTDEAWSRIDELIYTICRRTLTPAVDEST